MSEQEPTFDELLGWVDEQWTPPPVEELDEETLKLAELTGTLLAAHDNTKPRLFKNREVRKATKAFNKFVK